jgi:hypothetical protein
MGRAEDCGRHGHAACHGGDAVASEAADERADMRGGDKRHVRQRDQHRAHAARLRRRHTERQRAGLGGAGRIERDDAEAECAKIRNIGPDHGIAHGKGQGGEHPGGM